MTENTTKSPEAQTAEPEKVPTENVGDEKRETSWPLVLFLIHLYILGAYGLVIVFTNTSLLTIFFALALIWLGVLGTTAGAHRLWAHKTYKATKYLRIFLMLCQTLGGQGSIYDWVRSHRLHHKTFKTKDDPFYSNKNFLSAYIFSYCRNYSKKQQKMLEEIDMTDIEVDEVVMFQKKYYWILYFIFCILLPINTPFEYWNDTLVASIFVAFSLRYLITHSICYLVNSAHILWGLELSRKPSDSNMIFLITKSYWPQYHYLLPNDYQSGEFGNYGDGCMTAMIRVFAALGMATDLQTVSSEAVRKGLTEAVETDKPIVECIEEAAKQEMKNLPQDHYLNKSKFL